MAQASARCAGKEDFARVVFRLAYDAVGRDNNLADIFWGEFPSNVRKSDAADANRLIWDYKE